MILNSVSKDGEQEENLSLGYLNFLFEFWKLINKFCVGIHNVDKHLFHLKEQLKPVHLVDCISIEILVIGCKTQFFINFNFA